MPDTPAPTRMQKRRDTTIEALSRHFAADRLSISEFERRIDGVHAARTAADLDRLLEDLPTVDVVGRTDASESLLPDRSRDGRVKVALAVMGGTDRKGRWKPAERVVALGLMGGVEVDFREARLLPGVTTVYVVACMGAVEVIVPPGLPVESNGIAVMGGFDHFDEDATDPDPDRPRLRITGAAVMGGVSIEVRRPGETARDARRRRREERRRLLR